MQRLEEATGPDLGDGMGAYLGLLRHGPAGRQFIAAFIARLLISMVSLGMLLLIEERGYAPTEMCTPAWSTVLYALGTGGNRHGC